MPVMGGGLQDFLHFVRLVEYFEGHFASWFEGGSFSHSELAWLVGVVG
jgi:hypothetical protein